eukprot:4953103-Pyramimonas_sp.AAC.1
MAYLLLTNKHPFEDPSLCEDLGVRPQDDPVCMDGMMKSIMTSRISTSGPEWENVSCAAKHFVRSLLQVSINDMVSVEICDRVFRCARDMSVDMHMHAID